MITSPCIAGCGVRADWGGELMWHISGTGCEGGLGCILVGKTSCIAGNSSLTGSWVGYETGHPLTGGFGCDHDDDSGGDDQLWIVNALCRNRWWGAKWERRCEADI